MKKKIVKIYGTFLFVHFVDLDFSMDYVVNKFASFTLRDASSTLGQIVRACGVL